MYAYIFISSNFNMMHRDDVRKKKKRIAIDRVIRRKTGRLKRAHSV